MDKLFSRKIVFFYFLYSLFIVGGHADATVLFKNVVSDGSFISNVAYKIDHIFVSPGALSFFTLLSAFLLYRNLSEDNMKDKIRRRIKTLLIPWIVWNIIGMISYHDFDKGLSYLFRYFFTSRFCEQMWFVQNLLILLLFAPIFMRVFRRKWIREIALTAVFVLSYCNWPFLPNIDVFPSDRFFREVLRFFSQTPMYCLGVYLGLNWQKQIIEERYNGRYRSAVLITALAVLLLPEMLKNEVIVSTLNEIRPIALWLILSKKQFSLEPKWWMKISFYTYAVHVFFLYWIGKTVRMLGLFAEAFESQTVTIVFALGWRISSAIAAFLLVVISARILMRFTPRFYEVLTGGRALESKKQAL